jgi:hypothetical protein
MDAIPATFAVAVLGFTGVVLALAIVYRFYHGRPTGRVLGAVGCYALRWWLQ